MNIKLNPLNDGQALSLQQLLKDADPQQIFWLSGYFQGLASGNYRIQEKTVFEQVQSIPVAAISPKLTILFGSHTGRSEGLAKKFKKRLAEKNFDVEAVPMDDYNIRKLEQEQNLLVIVSTHGEGEPPVMAEDFHRFITGKRAPKLPNLHYSVLALGDKSYKLFCKTGFDINHALKNAGASELFPIAACDVDYEDDAEIWFGTILEKLSAQQSNSHSCVNNVSAEIETAVYNRKNPFRATVLNKQKITGRDSDKEVYHIEISLEGSGISYQPGDSLGILADNPPVLVEQVIQKLNFDPKSEVVIRKGDFAIKNALRYQLEITVLNREVIQKYADKTGLAGLKHILEDEEKLDKYLWGHDVLDLITDFPFGLSAQELVDILRPFPPRLYSISSCHDLVGDEVHITVSAVRYQNKERERQGAASTFLADRIETDSQIPVYIERNPGFRLPENEETPIIMVGAGTGIAPYRAFLQQREAGNMKGKSWLFFGERRFQSDFLYQVEWQKYLKKGILEKIDLAFSRDQKEKIYVQHRLAEQQAEIYKWIENGASFYLCGDMKNMAKDVQNTLLNIIQTQGGMSEEQAREYFKKLKKEKRFQTDVY